MYQPSNPGIAKEITAPETGETYRGWMALTETTMAFTSGSNIFSSRTYPAGFTCPAQINSIQSITGAIAAFVVFP